MQISGNRVWDGRFPIWSCKFPGDAGLSHFLQPMHQSRAHTFAQGRDTGFVFYIDVAAPFTLRALETRTQLTVHVPFMIGQDVMGTPALVADFSTRFIPGFDGDLFRVGGVALVLSFGWTRLCLLQSSSRRPLQFLFDKIFEAGQRPFRVGRSFLFARLLVTRFNGAAQLSTGIPRSSHWPIKW